MSKIKRVGVKLFQGGCFCLFALCGILAARAQPAPDPNSEGVEVQTRGRSGRSFRGGGKSFRGGRNVRSGNSFRGGRSFRGNRYSYRRGYGGRRYYGRGNRRGYGGALVAGVAGLAVGAAIASGGRSYSGRTRSYCADRFKSWNPRTGTYLGYDGLRHACP